MLVGAIGIGLLVVTIAWVLTLIIIGLGIKFESNFAWISLGFTTTLTIILLIIPLDKPIQSSQPHEYSDVDNTFIYQAIFFLFLFVNALLGLFSYLTLHCIEPVRVKQIKKFNLQK